jgi:hypothetical protein
MTSRDVITPARRPSPEAYGTDPCAVHHVAGSSSSPEADNASTRESRPLGSPNQKSRKTGLIPSFPAKTNTWLSRITASAQSVAHSSRTTT